MKTEATLEEKRLAGLGKTLKGVEKVLKMLGLDGIVSTKEIEKELTEAETAFQSLLVLGIMRRISYTDNQRALELFLPAVTNTKNYLPHPDLGGISPFEYREKYPPGMHEMNFLSGLTQEYQSKLTQEKSQKPDFNLEEDFTKFQNEFLNRIPVDQPFPEDGKMLSFREIIIEERRNNNHPENGIAIVGVKIFVENTAEGIGSRSAEIDDAYFSAMDELAEMQKEPQRRDNKRLEGIIKLFDAHEPYHRCGPESHRFYLNFAMAAFLADDTKKSFNLLDIALMHKPDYDLAHEMKRRFAGYIGAQ